MSLLQNPTKTMQLISYHKVIRNAQLIHTAVNPTCNTDKKLALHVDDEHKQVNTAS
jgi:hypothetical protein